MEGSSECKFKSICVFGGTKLGKDRQYLNEANDLGRVSAARNINLVSGRGSLRLMGVVASSTYVEGNKILSVIPKPLADKKIIGRTLGDEFKVANMHEQMENMLYNADIFIALPGSLGTLKEVFNIASWS